MAISFTVVMEFDGTTSVSQFVAKPAANALKLWLARLAEPNAFGLSRRSARLLQTAFVDDSSAELTTLKGVVGVWCTTALAGDKLALIHLVKTCR